MITIENVEVTGFNAAFRGMRNPMNSWDKSDSHNYDGHCELAGIYCDSCDGHACYPHFDMGSNDHELAMKLVNGGSVHAKFRRMINVTFDVTAPLYWWKEADTYKVGTVRNSCSTMHKIQAKRFELDDFSHEHLLHTGDGDNPIDAIVRWLNYYREAFLKTNDKEYWWQMIQLLPSSYNQRATVQLNYEVLANIYKWRKDHKLDEWRDFCKWIETLPYSELITTTTEVPQDA